MKRFSVSVAIVAAGLAIWPARAERQQARPNVTLELGVGSAVMLERPSKTVLIGDPEIVDVQTRTDRSVVLEPLNSGTTNLVFIDERGMVITNLTVLVRSARAI